MSSGEGSDRCHHRWTSVSYSSASIGAGIDASVSETAER